MERRYLLVMGGLLAGSAPGNDSRALVSNPAARASYLASMLDALSTKLGPRPAGSKAGETGMRLIEREMRRALPIVSLDQFTLRGWETTGEAEFEVAGQSLETYLAENSPGTPGGGARGTLRKSANGFYEIVDETRGLPLARAGISEFGRAISSLHGGTDTVPLFNLGRQDVPMLDRAARDSSPARAKAVARWIPGVRATNVAGTLKGASTSEILLVAHADTKYNTPGANDNTASLIAMLMVAHAVPGTRPPKTVGFLATTAEERGYLGAKNYARIRKEKGTLANVKICINLDSLTYGPNLQIATKDRELAAAILDVHRELGLPSNPRVLDQNDTMDSAPFLAAGARTVHLNSRGDDARTLPLWHRPEDRAETVKPEFVESSFQVLMGLLARLQK